MATTAIGYQTTTPFYIPDELNGVVATSFQFTLLGGSLSCGDDRTSYYWGCSQGLDLFLVSPPVNSSSPVLLPSMLSAWEYSHILMNYADSNDIATNLSTTAPYPHHISPLSTFPTTLHSSIFFVFSLTNVSTGTASTTLHLRASKFKYLPTSRSTVLLCILLSLEHICGEVTTVSRDLSTLLWQSQLVHLFLSISLSLYLSISLSLYLSISPALHLSSSLSLYLSICNSLICYIVNWMFLYQGCFGATNNSFAYVNISSSLFGEHATAFRLSYINGSLRCGDDRNNTLWGYTTSLLSSPLLSPRSSSLLLSFILPLFSSHHPLPLIFHFFNNLWNPGAIH